MKKRQALIVVLLFAACHVLAQTNAPAMQPGIAAAASRTNALSAPASLPAPKPKLHLFGPSQPGQYQPEPLTIEGLDTRAWTTVAETRTSREAFPSGETHEAGLCLFWWGAEPRPR